MNELEISRQTGRVRAALEAELPDPPRHLSFDELVTVVEGTASSDVIAHVASCDLCRGEADDLLPLHREPALQWWIGAAIAAAIVIALIAILLRATEQPAPHEPSRAIDTAPLPVQPPAEHPRYANPEWQTLVDDLLATQRLPFPDDLDELRGDTGTLRGPNDPPASQLEPAGLVIDETRPQFRWPHVAGARYLVSVFDGAMQVAESGPLTVNRWTPAKPLPRGRTYTWQVDAGSRFFPTPPAPPARFRIVSQRDRDDLDAAKREHPDDHLLRAALYARAGLVRDAERELAASKKE